MIEVEEKYRVTAEAASRIAHAVHASLPVREVDQVFLIKSSTWREFKAGEPVIRLRQAGETATLTVKSAISGTAAAESEVVVGSPEDARRTVELLGATWVTTVCKTRRRGHYGDVVVCIDTVDRLGDFVELEVVRADGNGPYARKWIRDARRALGLAGVALEPARYDTLIERLNAHR